MLIGCDSAEQMKDENKKNDNDDVVEVDNTPVLGCNISVIDKYNVCDVYFEEGLVSKIDFKATYPDKNTLNEKQEELENVFGEVLVSDLTLSLTINEENDIYMEYIGMDKESIGYICR